MKLSEELFVGERVKDLGTVVYALKRDIPLLGIWCVCRRPGGKFLFELMQAKEAVKPRNRKMEVLGVAAGRREAEEIILNLVSDKLLGQKTSANRRQRS